MRFTTLGLMVLEYHDILTGEVVFATGLKFPASVAFAPGVCYTKNANGSRRMAAGSLSEKRRRRTRRDGRCAGLLNGGALAACTILCAAGSGSYRLHGGCPAPKRASGTERKGIS